MLLAPPLREDDDVPETTPPLRDHAPASIPSTVYAIRGLFGLRPITHLAANVEMRDEYDGRTTNGSPATMGALGVFLPIDPYGPEPVLTVDVGRGFAEWSSGGRRVAALCEVDEGLIRRIRLYARPLTVRRDSSPDRAAFTAREREVADLVAMGLSNHEVAKTLVVSVRTVEFHLRNVFVKVGVRSRTELMVMLKE